eukprot:gene12140-14204_t
MANSKYEYVKSFEIPDALLPNVWIVVRIDGRGFHKFTQKHDYAKPNDDRGLSLMNRAALEVCKEFTDIVIGFGESDEYSFVIKRTCTLFERRESKITSSIVSYFTAQFVYRWAEYFVYWALVLKDNKTPNEAETELRGTLSEQKNEILFSRFGINYNNLPQIYRKGSVIYRRPVEETRIDTRTNQPIIKSKKRLVIEHIDIISDRFWKDNPDILKD